MAHGMLDILDPTIDDQTVLVAYQLHVDDEPHRLDSFQEALAAIAKSRNSSFFNNHLGNGVQIPEQAIPEHALSKWPVGIENVGNTCYLNSLLQFLFTIKPLRDLVLDIESFKMPIDEANFKSKQVGPGMVSKDEIERAQRCK